jgi:GntR family transcriptional regulator/MocR family aminotransferase
VGLPPLDLRGAPVDDEGLDVEAARRECPAPALIHVHPLHQYPTGARMTAARRQALLAWARACRAWVIEGDHLGEIVHDGAAPPALMQMQMQTQGQMQGQSRMQGQVRPLKAHGEANGQAARLPAQEPAPGRIVAGEDGQVLFMGTFNGIMFPALRLSYLVVPQRLVPAFTAVRGLFGDHPPLAMQQALCRFIDEGLLGIHMRRMRQLYRQRRDAAVAAAARHLPPQVRLGPLLGGTHGCLHLPAACADEPLAQRLVEAGFGVEMLSTYSWPRQGTNGLVFGYGAEDERGIESGMQQLGRHLYETLAGPAAQAGRGSRAAAGALPSVASRRGR